MGLSDGRKSFPIGLAVLIQYRSVTDTQPPSHPASHVAVAITLNAQASSLKTRMMALLEGEKTLKIYTSHSTGTDTKAPTSISGLQMQEGYPRVRKIGDCTAGTPSHWDGGVAAPRKLRPFSHTRYCVD